MNDTPRLNGEPLTAAETRALRIVQERLYRDPRTGRNLGAALRHLRSSPRYRVASEDRRAFLIADMRERYQRRVAQLLTEPRSPFYVREAVYRTARRRLTREGASGAMTIQRARARSRDYGLDPWDDAAIALHDAVFA